MPTLEMTVGAIMIVAGLALATLSGSFKFNFEIMETGYAIAFAGAVVFVVRLLETVYAFLTAWAP